MLDLSKKEWTDVGPGAHTPPPRHGHLMTVHADKLFMYGGYDELGAWSDAMYCLPVPYDQPFTPVRCSQGHHSACNCPCHCFTTVLQSCGSSQLKSSRAN